MPFISTIRRNWEQEQKQKEPLGTLDKFEITGGDYIYEAGGYRIHMFTSVGDHEFKVTPKYEGATHGAFSLQNNTLDVEYLVVAGGGSGATNIAGGGGAGGYQQGTITNVSGTQPVTVGDGASPSSPGNRYADGTRGDNSVFASVT